MPDKLLTHNERIEDELFRQALDYMDEGRATELTALLLSNPELVHQQVLFEGDNYFTEPTLIEFIAENPTRLETMPPNVIEIASIILDAGAKGNKAALDSTLALTASGRVAREQGAQEPLLDMLCEYGADPNFGLLAALAHAEFAAARRLIALGAKLDLPAAAALGQAEEVKSLLTSATADQRQLALALSAQHGRADVVSLLLESGADPNRYNPPGAHAHCTALHSAAIAGHIETVKVLVEAGARFDIGDTLHNSTALGWAKHAAEQEIVSYLESRLNGSDQ